MMMNNEIRINRIATGWLVQLPQQNSLFGMIGMTDKQFKNTIKSAMPGHDALLEAKEVETDIADEVKISADPDTHFFKTFDELLSFLKFKIVE